MANHILLAQIRYNGVHLQHCFCQQCRTRKFDEIVAAGFTAGQLFDITFKRILQSEEAKLNEMFQLTKRKIIYGKAYKHSCLQNTPYQDFGWWVRTQPNFMRLPESVREKFCIEVNQIDSVYNDWEKIVDNLTDQNLHHIDARKFSVNQFYRARNDEWCANYNDLMRGGGQADLVYEEHKYQRIVRFIVQTGILEDISHENILTSMLGRRLQRDLMKISTEMRTNNT